MHEVAEGIYRINTPVKIPGAGGFSFNRLASEGPKTLACMHGSAWRGDGAMLLRALADALTA